VFRRRDRKRGKIRSQYRRLEDGCPDEQEEVRRRRGGTERPPLRGRRPRRAELPQQHREVRPTDEPMVLRRGAHDLLQNERRRRRP
jgi:hypothetical protein